MASRKKAKRRPRKKRIIKESAVLKAWQEAAKTKTKKRPRKKRQAKSKEFSADIVKLLQSVERHYRKDTDASHYFSTVTVIAGSFVWAMRHGCSPLSLNSVISESLQLAFKAEGVPTLSERPIDPKELN